ncbi:uncharacterized protein LOC117108348 isoform X1 [Anneissia japonica]|uniref:uncharacterized protein LOC117108348 isoform X1 n=1 Tax=Anneissia japonica TaxID=1529436 RepID=UPI0014258D75|nr:uncharacterized protein LOC117108348 isoform X1 [Anneissia japonica]XP_033106230.1 uncharacterized protein LOC117108348 isoform X2 [Anneissia japonica]XP_033106233.1 uncharacterized protein LOC117108348 isoform X1 [Anneissia japonica]XP_033106234.1 uncharacterized protein LOC117108348 isoform X1 [Anneissia japonica]
MNTHGNKNYFKIAFIFLDIVTEHLRNIFRQEWDTQCPKNPWHDDNNSLQYLKTEATKLGTWKSLKNPPKSGDRDDWDPTTLFSVLLYSKTINLSKAKCKQIEELRKIRNIYFAHPPTASISRRAFRVIYQDIKTCMISLNCSKYMQKQMDDVKKEIMKVPQGYMKKVEAKLCIIKILETDNNKLLMQLLDLLQKYGNSILFLLIVIIVAMVFYLFLHQSYGPIKLFTRTCNNSNNIFLESQKPVYYIGHEWDINTGANVLANGSYQVVSITGPPAIGKTATAVAVGQVLKNNHGYQVAFVDFKQINVSSVRIRTDIYKDIVLSIDYELENVPDSLQEFKLLIIKLTTCPTLLIFDNIENILNSTSKEIFYEITKLCLAINKVKVLTTSRKEFDIIGVAIYPIKLEPLPKSASKCLLFKLLPGFLQKSLVTKIAEKTGGIPLLLEVAASLVRSKYYEESELLKRFEELPILVILNDTKDMTESSNYYKLLKILFDGFDPSVQFTFIAVGAVPVILDQTSADAVLNLNFSEKVDLYPLVNYNLLKIFDMPSGQRLYGMHSVISEFTRLVAEDNPHWSKIQLAGFKPFYAIETESGNCESLSLIAADYSDMTLQQPIWERAGNVQKFLVHNRLIENSEQCGVMVAYRAALEFFDRGQYAKSMDILLRTKQLIKDDDNQLLKTLANFALSDTAKYLKQGNLNLSIKFSNLLIRTLNLIETDPCFVATSLFKLGTLSSNTSFYIDAAFVLKQALTYYRQQYQQQNCSEENLVSLVFKLRESLYTHWQYHASIADLRILADLLKINDDQLEFNILETDWFLAIMFYKAQDYESCFQIVRRVLMSSYEIDYHKQKHVFQALTDLALKAADTYFKQGNFAMTIQFNILSLNTLKMLETDSCFVSLLYFHVGLLFYRLGIYGQATTAFNQTWTFHKQNKCDEDNLGLVAFHLGRTYYHCGQYNDSIDVLHMAADQLEKDYLHQFMANSFLAFSYSEIHEHKTSFQITRNILINNSYLYTLNSSLYEGDLMNLTNIALLAATKYHNQGKLNQSIEFYNLSIATLKMVDAHSSLLASVYANLAIVLFGVERHADAAVALNTALEFHKWKGCDDEQLIVGAFSIWSSFYTIGQYYKSIEVLLGTIDVLKKNSDHQFEANVMLVSSYFMLHDYENAFQILRKVLDSSYQVDYLKYKEKLETLRKLARAYKVL